MTPQQKIKWIILDSYFNEYGTIEKDGIPQYPPITEENIDDIYEDVEEGCDYLQDIKYEIRGGDVETDIPCDYSRHYEAKSVAALAPDKTWVGWTYWYGGGKHGEPASIDWVGSAYDVKYEAEEQLVVVQTFTKVTG
jgi:hypothetical protein